MVSLKSCFGLALAAFLAVAQGTSAQTGSSSPTVPKAFPGVTPGPASGPEPAYLHPETAEQRKQRLATWEDPGTDPDPRKSYIRYGYPFHIEKYDRVAASFDQPEGWVRPIAYVNLPYEIYQLNDKFVWVWVPDKTPEAPPAPPDGRQVRKYDDKTLATLTQFRTEFEKLDVPDSGKTIRFEKSTDGLPEDGSWRNSLAVADMNDDGFLDIVAPPQRGGNGLPTVYLGDGKGHWKIWSTVRWPYEMNYGSVVAADFNHDGHMDLAFGVHLNGLHAWLGDGKGNFTDASEGLPNDWPCRRVAIADVNRDGWPDIVAISEGPVPGDTATVYSKLMVFLNGGKKSRSWTRIDVSQPQQQLGGDWLASGDFNGDGYPDFAGASVYFGGTEILYVSDGPKKWKGIGSLTAIPRYAYYYANTAGRFVKSARTDDAILSYLRNWPGDIDPAVIPDPSLKETIGIDRISFAGKEPKRIPLVRWEGHSPVTGMAAGDVDGDGNLDVVYLRSAPRQLVVLLGDGKGGFRKSALEGIVLPDNPIYDLKLVDVDGDKKLDIVLSFESGGGGITTLTRQTGSIEVYLNRGMAPASAK